jgi:hypothetical protein
MSNPTQTESPNVPAYSASGKPVTKGDRLAFKIWTIFVLITLLGTLTMFVFDKLYFLATGR